MPDELLRCARIATELDEPLAGTAPVVTGWIAVEHPGPWSAKAPTAAELGDAAASLTADGVRVQLIRRVGRAHGPAARLGDPATVLLAHSGVQPQDRWMRRLQLDDPWQLASLDPTVTLSPTPPSLGEPVEHDVWLLCTHARRDACCALHGRPVAQALDNAGVEVWETTHTGGHRFAATGVVLPDGLSLGRLDTVDAASLALELAAGKLPTELLRGRCALPQPAQAAEAALRIRLGATARDAVLPLRTRTDGAVASVELEADGASWRATVVIGTAATARPVSDAADETRPATYDVVELTAQ